MSRRVEVATIEEFETTDRKVVEVEGIEIGVLRVDGEFRAILNTCPHQQGPVAEGELRKPIVADVPDVGERVEERYDEDRTVVRCPLHQWAFDVETGENVADPEAGLDLVTYDVAVEDGTVYLEL